VNYLIIESLQKFHYYLGDDLRSVSDQLRHLLVALGGCRRDIRRLTRIFLKDDRGRRPVFGGPKSFKRTWWSDYIPFHEYFHGDNGAGVGASHQTGWTGLVAKLIQQTSEYSPSPVEGNKKTAGRWDHT
jgi:hypothetical protein